MIGFAPTFRRFRLMSVRLRQAFSAPEAADEQAGDGPSSRNPWADAPSDCWPMEIMGAHGGHHAFEPESPSATNGGQNIRRLA